LSVIVAAYWQTAGREGASESLAVLVDCIAVGTRGAASKPAKEGAGVCEFLYALAPFVSYVEVAELSIATYLGPDSWPSL
jgi:hypothetical protein